MTDRTSFPGLDDRYTLVLTVREFGIHLVVHKPDSIMVTAFYEKYSDHKNARNPILSAIAKAFGEVNDHVIEKGQGEPTEEDSGEIFVLTIDGTSFLETKKMRDLDRRANRCRNCGHTPHLALGSCGVRYASGRDTRTCSCTRTALPPSDQNAISKL